MRLPKTISCIVIILLVLLPCIYCLYFQAKQQMIRYEMREKLESDQLQTVIVPVKEFRWYEENREIIVNGTMFDVKSIERKGDDYIITGLFDEHETALHIAMGRLQQKQDDDPDAQLISIILSQTLMPPVAVDISQLNQSNKLASRLICFDENLYDTILSIHTPPPRA